MKAEAFWISDLVLNYILPLYNFIGLILCLFFGIKVCILGRFCRALPRCLGICRAIPKRLVFVELFSSNTMACFGLYNFALLVNTR